MIWRSPSNETTEFHWLGWLGDLTTILVIFNDFKLQQPCFFIVDIWSVKQFVAMIWKVLKYIFIRMRWAKRALGKSSHNSLVIPIEKIQFFA